MVTDEYTIQIFADETGHEPFINRIRRIELGNFGVYRSVGEGVYELKFSFGPGYRVYFAKVDKTVIMLLAGGDKGSQARDIMRAKLYWQQYKEQR